MRNFLLLVIVISSLLPAHSQQNKPWSIALSPAIVQAPRLRCAPQLGVELAISKRSSILTELAWLTGPGSPDSSFMQNRFLRIRSEFRCYIEADRSVSSYLSGQIGLIFRKWKDLAGGGYYDNGKTDTLVSYDRADINSPILTATIQWGRKWQISDHFGLDLFTGAGVRSIFTRYADVSGIVASPSITRICRIIPAPDPANAYNGTVIRFQWNIGFRLFYSL